MANQPELIQYDVGVYQLEVTDPVDGGVGAVSNAPLLNLSNRTAYLKKHVDDLESGATIPPTLAPKNSPALTGTPTVPTAPLGDNSTTISNTAFVQATVNGVLTKSVAGGGNVTLTAIEAGNGILVFTGVLTANIAVIVPATSKSWIVSNQTSGAYTLTVKTAAGTGIVVAQGKNQELWCDGTKIVQSTNDFKDVALTGTPTAPTAASGDSSQTLANTGFVFNATDGMSTINVAGSSDVTLTQAQYGSAILALTGAITSDISLKFPQQSGQWIVSNNATGAFTIAAKTTAAGGATAVLPQGSAVIVYSDGTNMYFASAGGQTSFTRTSFAPAAGSTTLVVPTGYTPGNILVEKNGALLEPTDYTATDGGTIVLNTATVTNDTLNVYAFKTFTIADAVRKSGDTMTGPLTLAVGSSGLPSVQGSFKNLKLSATGTNSHVAVTVDEIVTEDDAFASYLTLRTVSLDIDSATVGANGLDTGALAASTWYSVWAISNSTTTAGLLSLSATAPALPAGYAYKARVGWIRTDATANKYPKAFSQQGRLVQYKVTPGSNVTASIAIASGVQGSPITPTWVPLSVSAAVPSTASAVMLSLQNQGANQYIMAAPNGNYGAFGSTTNPPPVVVGSTTGGAAACGSVKLLLESSNVYCASNAAASVISVVGWEDNL